MQENNAKDFASWVMQGHDHWAYLWVLIISMWGGTVNYVRRLRAGKSTVVSIAEWMGELFVAGFAGLLVYWGCEYYKVSGPLSAIAIATAGLMSGRTLQLFEEIMESRVRAQVGLPAAEDNKEPVDGPIND